MQKLELRWLGQQPYEPLQEAQRQLTQLRHQGLIPDQLLLLEHQPVITYGKKNNHELLVSKPEHIQAQDIAIVHSDRGGEITYHGPGQLVCYPIFQLQDWEQDLHQYLRNLEQVGIELLKNYGIEAHRVEGRTGVWVHNHKVQAVGIRASKWVTSHGISLNVKKVSGFQHIVPCGIQDAGITSLQELGIQASLPEVAHKITTFFEKIFNRQGVWVRTTKDNSLHALSELLPPEIELDSISHGTR